MMPGTTENSRKVKGVVTGSLRCSFQLRVGLFGTKIKCYNSQDPGWLHRLNQKIPELEEGLS